MYQRKNVKLNTDKSTKEKGRKKGRDTNNPKMKISSSKNPFLFFLTNHNTKDLEMYQRKIKYK